LKTKSLETDLLVLGGGPGGYAAAFLAADNGREVTLVDQEPSLGGVCLLRGCIPSKALLGIAKVMGETQRLAEWGIDFQAPKIDLAKLRAQKQKVLNTLTGGLDQLAKKRKVRVIRARGRLVNSHQLALQPVDEGPEPEAELISFRWLILAAGSRAVQLSSLLHTARDRVMSSREALDLPEIPSSLLVIGGGYIGLELGTVYGALGSRVTVVEMTDGLLPGVDRDLVRPLERKLRKVFSAIHLGTKVAKVEPTKHGAQVFFDGAAGDKSTIFSRILVAVGRRPNTEQLGLENTSIQLDEHGFVRTDEFLRTAEPHIYAIGDLAGQPMLAHKASHQGKVAVQNILGEAIRFEPRAIPAVVFTDPEIAWAGLTEEAARRQGREIETAVFPWGASGRAQADGHAEGLTKWIIDPKSRRVIGCGIVGTGAGELISEAVLAIELGAHIQDVAETIHPHPTLSETLGFAAEVYLGTATDLYRPKAAGAPATAKA